MRNSGITDCCQGQRICTVAVFYADEAPQKRPRKTLEEILERQRI